MRKKNKRIEIIVEGDTKTIVKTLLLHFIKIPQINWISIPQPEFSELTINFNSKTPELGFNSSLRSFYDEIKESSLRMNEFIGIIKSKKLNFEDLQPEKNKSQKSNLPSLRNTIRNLKEKINIVLKNKYNN